jgi:hypothetical protein
MKKLLLTLVVSVLCLTGARAEDGTTPLVATLSHEGSLTAYYGKTALKEAYEAAKEGDIITLSAGTFTGVNMNKNITLRGVGAWQDNSTDNAITNIEGSELKYKLQDNDYELTVEGVRYLCRVLVDSDVEKECTFRKVFFNYQNYDYSFIIYNKVFAKLSHCVTIGHLQIYKGICSNCVFNGADLQSSTATVTLQNCVIRDWQSYNHYYNNIGTYDEDVLTNCIFIYDYESIYNKSPLKVSNNVHNCVVFNTKNDGIDIFQDITNTSNKIVTDRDNFFKNAGLFSKKTDQYGDVTSYYVYFDNLTKEGTGLFELSDEAKEIYKGNDGTVAGVWGGTMPFNYIPNNPRISKCDIVPKVDESGKLSVTIEVAQ